MRVLRDLKPAPRIRAFFCTSATSRLDRRRFRCIPSDSRSINPWARESRPCRETPRSVVGYGCVRRSLSSKRLLVSAALFASFAFLTSGAFAQARSDFVNDPAFGKQGLVTGGVGPISLSASLSPQAFATDKQGRVLVGAANGYQWQVWRFLPNGDLDSSFGDQGKVVITEVGSI